MIAAWTLLPIIDPWVLLLLAGLGMAAAALRAWRERKRSRTRRTLLTFGLRLVALMLLVLVALNPTEVTARETPGRPHLAVLVDSSASMAVSDVSGQTRLAAALATLQADSGLLRLHEAFHVKPAMFDHDRRPVDLARVAPEDAVGRDSDIATAVAGAVRDVADRPEGGAVVVVSDGRATRPGLDDAAKLALARSVPVWTWCLGGDVPRRDVWLEAPPADALAFAGAQVKLTAELRQIGYPARAFDVELLHEGTVIGKQQVVPEDGVARVAIDLTAPDSGEHRYVFRVAQEPGEADTDNNRCGAYLNVVGRKVRVLLAEGEPHWDTKFLVQTLKRDPNVDLTAVYRLGPHRFAAVVSEAGAEQRRETRNLFPQTAADLADYDILLFGRGCEAFFNQTTSTTLPDFVASRGLGVIFTRGKAYGGRFPTLTRLEPVSWRPGIATGVRLEPTAAAMEGFLSELGDAAAIEKQLDLLPPLDQAFLTSGEKPLAVILARGDTPHNGADEPILLSAHRYGQGRVVTLNVGGLWRWAFRAAGEGADEKLYGRFWNALLRWMLADSAFLPGHNIALRVGRRKYTDEQPLDFMVHTRGLEQEGYQPALRVSGPEHTIEVEASPLRGGGYTASAGPFPPGQYTVALHSNVGTPKLLQQTVEVVSASIESRNLSADPEAMARLAQTTGAEALAADDVTHLDRIYDRWQASRRLSDEQTPLWDRAWLLFLLLAVMGAEWYARRLEGLL